MIQSEDIKVLLSILTGAAGGSQAQGNANASLGKYASTTETSSELNALFDRISEDENAESAVDYRCIFILNDSAQTAYGVKVWVSAETAGGASIAIGLDPTGVSDYEASAAQAVQIATEADAPAGVAFSAPTTKATGLLVGDVPAGSCFAVWYRRTAADNGAKDLDGFTLGIGFGSGE